MLRSSPLRRKTPIKPKRDAPRRGAPKRKPGKTKALREHHAHVASMPCIACRRRPVEVHHVISDGFKRITRDHRLVLPVCPACHREGPDAIHVIGTAAWNGLHGIDQLARAVALWGADL